MYFVIWKCICTIGQHHGPKLWANTGNIRANTGNMSRASVQPVLYIGFGFRGPSGLNTLRWNPPSLDGWIRRLGLPGSLCFAWSVRLRPVWGMSFKTFRTPTRGVVSKKGTWTFSSFFWLILSNSRPSKRKKTSGLPKWLPKKRS